MNKLTHTLSQKLFQNREKETPVKPDYVTFLNEVFGSGYEIDSALNDSAELAEAVNGVLGVLSDIERYCVEEECLHGKTRAQIADEFRQNVDMAEFTRAILKDVYNTVKQEYMDAMELIFSGMEDNSFRELDYIEGMHPDNLPKNDTYYEPDADKKVVDVLRDAVKRYDGLGLSYEEIFENVCMKGQTEEELGVWLSERMEGFVRDIYCTAMRKLRMQKRCRDLKQFFKDGRPACGIVHANDKCARCIYAVTRDFCETPDDCSACKTNEVKEWLNGAISELPSKKERVMKTLYDIEDGRYSETHKETAVKLRLESREYVRKLENSALKELRKKAMRELLTTDKR